MRVLLLSRYERNGASSRVRFYQYVPELASAGVDVRVAPLFNESYLEARYAQTPRSRLKWESVIKGYWNRIKILRGARAFDLVWIEKELLPWMPAGIEQALARLDVPYVVDYDDAWFHRYDSHSSRTIRRWLGDKIDSVIRGAELVTVGNDYLAQRARAAGARRIRVIPSAVDTRHYHLRPRSNDRVTIGWIGTPVTQHYLEGIAGVLAAVQESYGVRVLLIGAQADCMPSLDIDARVWDARTEVAALQEIDIGIMPLKDSQWERGKCGYKLIQYMACGSAVVASPVGMNPEIVGHGECGELAATADDWRQALGRLIEDQGLRESLGRSGRLRVERHYSTQSVFPELLGSLRTAAGGVEEATRARVVH